MVQHLPVLHDARHAPPALVAHTPQDHSLSVEVEHHTHQHLPLCSRLLCPVTRRRDDIHRLHGAPRQRYRQLPLRSHRLP